MKEHNPEYWKDYDERCRALEAEGMTRSDAQAVVGAEELQAERLMDHCEQPNDRPEFDLNVNLFGGLAP